MSVPEVFHGDGGGDRAGQALGDAIEKTLEDAGPAANRAREQSQVRDAARELFAGEMRQMGARGGCCQWKHLGEERRARGSGGPRERVKFAVSMIQVDTWTCFDDAFLRKGLVRHRP